MNFNHSLLLYNQMITANNGGHYLVAAELAHALIRWLDSRQPLAPTLTIDKVMHDCARVNNEAQLFILRRG